jgi:general secretion pathway protein K
MVRNERGTVFVLALAALVGVVAAVAGIAASQRLAFRAQLARIETPKARLAAEAGIARVLATLSVQPATDPVTLQDEWATLGSEGDDLFRVGSGSFRIQVLDAASRINLNTVTLAQLQRLPMTEEQIESLLDWREGAREPRAQGAKDEYYNNLPTPYNAKLRRFDTVDELLLVRGFTAVSLLEPQTDVVSTAITTGGSVEDTPALIDLFTTDAFVPTTAPTGQTKLNVNAGNVTAQQIAQRVGVPLPVAAIIVAGRPYARLGDVLVRPGVPATAFRNILDNLVTTGAPRVEGRINLNTASETVLLSVPALTPDTVQAILTRQSSGFTSLGEITTVPGLNAATTLQQVADLFDTRSQSFLVRVIGQAGGAETALEAQIVIENGRPRVLRIQESPYANPIESWGWIEETTNEITLREAE